MVKNVNHLISVALLACSTSFVVPAFSEEPLVTLQRDSIRSLPFDVLLNKVSQLVGVPTSSPLFDEMKDAKLKLGGFDHAQGIRPDDSVTPIKVSNWVEVIKPICRSQAMTDRFPDLDTNVKPFFETAYGRRMTSEEADIFSVGAGIALPARIEAEHYSAAVDLTEGNAFVPTQCEYRGLNVDVENSPEGDCNVGQAGEGESLDYSIGQAGKRYDLIIRAASQVDGARMSFQINGNVVGSINVRNEGWQNYSDYTIANVFIPSNVVLTAVFDTDWSNFNYMYLLESNGDQNRNNVNYSKDNVSLNREQARLVNCVSILSSAEFRSY